MVTWVGIPANEKSAPASIAPSMRLTGKLRLVSPRPRATRPFLGNRGSEGVTG